MSVVEITKAERYCNGEPVSGGLYDLRLGVTDFNTRCETCGNTYRGSNRVNDCPGHFGHIEVCDFLVVCDVALLVPP
jgi:DNA-directed RNA polymerase II subunit RPB1